VHIGSAPEAHVAQTRAAVEKLQAAARK